MVSQSLNSLHLQNPFQSVSKQDSVHSENSSDSDVVSNIDSGVKSNSSTVSDSSTKLSFSTSITSLSTQSTPRPFVKWVGGKTQLLPEIVKYVPKRFNTYFEPFLGGGAVLFQIHPKHAVVNDLNGELINAYKQVQTNPEQLIHLLKQMFNKDTKEYYMSIRALDRSDKFETLTDVQRAARFIYLNKAGFNGLWRVNKKGQNNVPYGQHTKLTVPEDAIRVDSEFFKDSDVTFLSGDYRTCVQSTKKGDFVYFDPPYIPVNPTSNFVNYTKAGFGLAQQKELAQLAKELYNKGAYVMLSNSDTPLTRKLYKDFMFHVHHVEARRSINRNGKKRGAVGEVLITTY